VLLSEWLQDEKDGGAFAFRVKQLKKKKKKNSSTLLPFDPSKVRE